MYMCTRVRVCACVSMCVYGIIEWLIYALIVQSRRQSWCYTIKAVRTQEFCLLNKIKFVLCFERVSHSHINHHSDFLLSTLLAWLLQFLFLLPLLLHLLLEPMVACSFKAIPFFCFLGSLEKLLPTMDNLVCLIHSPLFCQTIPVGGGPACLFRPLS